nr:L106 [uncultured bacterium]
MPASSAPVATKLGIGQDTSIDQLHAGDVGLRPGTPAQRVGGVVRIVAAHGCAHMNDGIRCQQRRERGTRGDFPALVTLVRHIAFGLFAEHAAGQAPLGAGRAQLGSDCMPRRQDVVDAAFEKQRRVVAGELFHAERLLEVADRQQRRRKALVTQPGIGNAAGTGVGGIVVGELVLEQVIEIVRQRAADVHPRPPKIGAVAQRLFVGVVVGGIDVQPAAGLERKIAARRLQLEALAVGDRPYPRVGLDALARRAFGVQLGTQRTDQRLQLFQALLHGFEVRRRRCLDAAGYGKAGRQQFGKAFHEGSSPIRCSFFSLGFVSYNDPQKKARPHCDRARFAVSPGTGPAALPPG